MFLQISRKGTAWKTVNVFCAVLVTWSMTGCGVIESLERDGGKPVEPPMDKFDFIDRHRQQNFVEKDENASGEIVASPVQAGKDEIASKSREVLVRKPVAVPEKAKRQIAPRFYEDFIVLDADEELDVKLTFNSTPLVDTLPAFADILGFNFTSDPDIRMNVTLNINSRMTKRELWENFDDMLRLAGCGAVKSGQMVKVMLQAKIPMQGETRVGGADSGRSCGVISRTMKNVVSRDAMNQLRNFLSKAGRVADIAKTNTVLVSDDEANIPRLREILELMDEPARSNWPSVLLQCHNVKPSKMVDELTALLPVLGLAVTLSTDRSESPGSVRLSGVDRLQVLAASAANQEMLDQLNQWVDILDNASSMEQERLYIYKVAHGKARQLAQALATIFSIQGSAITVDTNTGNTRTENLNSQATRQLNLTVTGNNRNTTNVIPITQVDKASSIFDTPVRVFADGANNRLVIRTTPRTYAMIKAMLDRMDVVPAQVLLQILIVEIKLNDSNEFGLDFNAIGSSGSTGISAGGDFIKSGSTTPSGGEGFSLGIFDSNNPNEKFAKIKALAGRDNVTVISSPQLVVTSNTVARIQVGQNVPLLTSDYTNTSSNDNIVRSYDYEETGIVLDITPQVTSSDLISLEIDQKVSEAVSNPITTAKDTPVIDIRKLETAMTIANGQTMVIGGMIQEKNTDRISSVPLIADIPFLRRLFGNTEQAVSRTEMLVLITGYIINEKSPVEDMVRRYNNAVRTLSTFERKLEDEHSRDMNQLKRIKEDREVKRQVSAAVAKPSAEKTAAPEAAPAETGK
ncbi:MAG: hypothetical protein IKZ31_02505 [Lentisphaeria bacterium]|nr:hypothetical protein [Lentisphaeria bacterium]